jgi:hypothetical protein
MSHQGLVQPPCLVRNAKHRLEKSNQERRNKVERVVSNALAQV